MSQDEKPADGSWESLEGFFGQRDNLSWLYDGFDLYGNPTLCIAAPKGLSDECSTKLRGAIYAYTLGISSVDYTIKRYIEKKPRRAKESPTDVRSDKLLDLSRANIRLALQAQSDLLDLPDRVGLVAAGAALVRLESSFDSSSLLIRLGHNFEAATIMKLILEQLGWALRVHEIADASFFEIPPSQCISDLKKLLPSAGSFYGVLNEEAHLKPELVNRFIRLTKAGASVMVRDRSYGLVSSFMYLCLADAFCVTLETVYRDHLKKVRHIQIDSTGKALARTNRPVAMKIRRVKSEFAEANRGNSWVNHLSRIFT